MFINFGGATEEQIRNGLSKSTSEYLSADEDSSDEIETFHQDSDVAPDEIRDSESLPDDARLREAVQDSFMCASVPQQYNTFSSCKGVDMPSMQRNAMNKDMRKVKSCHFSFTDQSDMNRGFVPLLHRISSSTELSAQNHADVYRSARNIPSTKPSKVSKPSTWRRISDAKLESGNFTRKVKPFFRRRYVKFILLLIFYSCFMCFGALCFQLLETPEEQQNLKLTRDVMKLLGKCECLSGRSLKLFKVILNRYSYLKKSVI